MTQQTFNILVLGTSNSVRSLMAEILINAMGRNRFRAYSAGSWPNGVVHPFVIEKSISLNYPHEKLRSKSWDEFVQPDAPQMNCVITVCDHAAREIWPVWPGQPLSMHWGFADPCAILSTSLQQHEALTTMFWQMMSKLRRLVNLPFEALDDMTIEHEIWAMGISPLRV